MRLQTAQAHQNKQKTSIETALLMDRSIKLFELLPTSVAFPVITVVMTRPCLIVFMNLAYFRKSLPSSFTSYCCHPMESNTPLHSLRAYSAWLMHKRVPAQSTIVFQPAWGGTPTETQCTWLAIDAFIIVQCNTRI